MSKSNLINIFSEIQDNVHKKSFDSFYNVNFLKKQIEDLIIESTRGEIDYNKIRSMTLRISVDAIRYTLMAEDKLNHKDEQ